MWRSTGVSRPRARYETLRRSIARTGLPELAMAEMKAVAQPFAEEVEADDRDGDRDGGADERRPGLRDVALRVADHDAPVGGGRLRAEAEIGERRAAHQGEADEDARLDDDGRPDIGQDFAVLGVERALAAGARGGDVVLARSVECGAAHDAHEARRRREAERDRRLELPRTEPGD